MDKWAIGGLVAVIAVGTTGGSMYANRQLKQFYSEVNLKDKRWIF
ncbi:DUF945 domain-containing protein [Kingella negevensis]|nr:DUF945 domain-containing protein [Kingella negevensis]MDK4689574.1 hypothetical protein [Kingella negevensis]WII90420.1 hypothetical protein QEO93_08110 [Kingella negevensis]